MSDQSIEELAFELAETNEVSKGSKDLREELRKRFWELADQEVKCATKTVSIPDWVIDTSDYMSYYHPEWNIVEEDDESLVLVEKPSLKEFSITVRAPDDQEVKDSRGRKGLGFVVTRTIKGGSQDIDLEVIKTDDPELYERITDDPKVPAHVADVLQFVAKVDEYVDEEGRESLAERLGQEWLLHNPQPRPLKADDEIKLADKAKLIKSYLRQKAGTPTLNIRLAKEDEV